MAGIGEWQDLKLQRQGRGFMDSSHAKHEEFELDLEGGRKPFKD